MLRCDKDGNFYVGYTKNLKQRFEQHEKGLVESTRERRPLRLIYYEACLSMHDAKKREIPENLLWENFFEAKAQILFHWVNLGFQFRIGIDLKPLLKKKAFHQQERWIGIVPFKAFTDGIVSQQQVFLFNLETLI